jgi:release factor glutamine methyltransferase
VGSEPLASIGSLIDAATERLRAAGVTKPRREANRLWAWQHRSSTGQAVLDRGLATDTPAQERFEAAVSRRVTGEPLAYVLGSAGFRNLVLAVDRRVLIPRPETELLVDHALQRVRTGRLLDVCTGSGCLALALAQEGRFTEVFASDLSGAALSVAEENARAHQLPVRLIRCDLAEPFSDNRFDLIVANPPYLTEGEYQALDHSVKAWEPGLALSAGPDGLAPTARLLGQAATRLAPGGWLLMELDSTRAGGAAGLAAAAGLGDITVLNDLFGRARYLIARRGQAE